MKLSPTIIQDPKEQNPLSPFQNLPWELGTLQTGDYSIRGLTHLITVERKSLPDLLACVGRERERFSRELQRLRAYRFRMLVVEATAAELEGGKWLGQIVPAQVLGSLASWCAEFQLPVWLAGSHDAAGRWVERYLFQCARTVAKEVEAVSGFVEDAMKPTTRRKRAELPASIEPAVQFAPETT